tara:strand:+ start:10037 stop:11836 length:1800 start_codon:yes stop_codon:yes gene_type:complete
MEKIPERSEIEQKYKWDLESIYSEDEEWRHSLENVRNRLGEFEPYKGKVCNNGETLLEILGLVEVVAREMRLVGSYAKMHSDVDKRDQKFQSMLIEARSVATELGGLTSFIEPEIQELGNKGLELLLKSNGELEIYRHYLSEIIRVKDHVRSAEVETLLADMGEIFSAPNEIYGLLMHADMSFPKVRGNDQELIEITHVNFTKFMREGDRETRKKVYQKFYREIGKFRNTIGAMLKNNIIVDVKSSRAHNYENSRSAAMNDSNIPTEVYDGLVETVRENLDVLHRHIELKKKSQAIEKLKMWDLYVPMVSGDSPVIKYDQAIDHVIESVSPLGEEYGEVLKEGLNSRWIDVYENRGKYSGAYSGGTYDTKPFILMNYQNDIQSMFTLAHELGHSMHSKLTNTAQPYIYSGYDIFVAEVASLVNEALLTEYLLENTEEESFRAYILDEAIERFRSTLYRQTLFADFEHQIHQVVESGGALVPDRLDEIYKNIKNEFYKPIEMDKYIQREWMRIPHFYYNYYVYQYATGISAAVSLARDILDGKKNQREKYISFLKSGSSKYPIDLLKETGVDMTSKKPIENSISVYKKYLTEMESIIESE